MRLNGIRLDDDAYLNTPLYKTSKFLTKRIGLDYDDLINNIHDNVGSLDKIKEIFHHCIKRMYICSNKKSFNLLIYHGNYAY